MDWLYSPGTVITATLYWYLIGGAKGGVPQTSPRSLTLLSQLDTMAGLLTSEAELSEKQEELWPGGEAECHEVIQGHELFPASDSILSKMLCAFLPSSLERNRHS